jgi:hypothetical protein
VTFSIEAWIAFEPGGYQYQHAFTREMRNAGPLDGYAFAAFATGGDELYVERVVGRAANVTPNVRSPPRTHHVLAPDRIQLHYQIGKNGP